MRVGLNPPQVQAVAVVKGCGRESGAVAAQQQDRCRREAGKEAEPDADGLQAEGVGEEPGGGESDDPVADDGDAESALGVVEFAQESDADVLGAVEELQECGDDQQVGGDGEGPVGRCGGRGPVRAWAG